MKLKKKLLLLKVVFFLSILWFGYVLFFKNIYLWKYLGYFIIYKSFYKAPWFFVFYVFKNDQVAKDKKALWAVVLFLGNVVAMPVYWYLYVWREPEEIRRDIKLRKI